MLSGKVCSIVVIHHENRCAFPDNIAYDHKLQDTELAYLFSSEAAQSSLAENYVGLPF